MISKLLQPSFDIVEGNFLADIIYKQSSYSATIVSWCDCSISLLPRCVPYLRLDCLPFRLNTLGCELYSNCRLKRKKKKKRRSIALRLRITGPLLSCITKQHDEATQIVLRGDLILKRDNTKMKQSDRSPLVVFGGYWIQLKIWAKVDANCQTNCGLSLYLGFQTKLIAREPRKKIWFSNARVTNKDN